MLILYYESLGLSKYSVLLWVIHLCCLFPTSSYQVSKWKWARMLGKHSCSLTIQTAFTISASIRISGGTPTGRWRLPIPVARRLGRDSWSLSSGIRGCRQVGHRGRCLNWRRPGCSSHRASRLLRNVSLWGIAPVNRHRRDRCRCWTSAGLLPMGWRRRRRWAAGIWLRSEDSNLCWGLAWIWLRAERC